MSGVHMVGPAAPHQSLLQEWARNGLQMVTHVKPETGDDVRLRGWLGADAFLISRDANNGDLRDGKIQDRWQEDPEAAAIWRWNRDADLRARCPGYNARQMDNEPVFVKGNPEMRLWQIKQFLKYVRQLLDLATAAGEGITLFNFSRGTPEPEEWELFYEVWRYALSKNRLLPPGKMHILSLHQYGGTKKGRGALFHEKEWLALRFELTIRPKLPADLKAAPYVITEAFVDMPLGWRVVYGENDEGRQIAAEEWLEYNVWLADHAPGCKGAAVYTLHQEGGFYTFDFANDPLAWMLARQKYPKMKPAVAAPGGGGSTGGGTNPLPLPTTLEGRLARRLGARFKDVRATLPTNQERDANGNLRYVFPRFDSRRMGNIVFHHTTGPRTYGPVQIANGHIARKFAGAGYHFCICLGILYYMGSVDTYRAHVAERNHEALGIVFSGTYTNVLPPADEIELARILVQELDAFYGHQKRLWGHGQFALPGHGTSCPGRITQILPTLRQVADPYSGFSLATLQKWAYWLEVAARGAALEGFAGAHDGIVQVSLPPIYSKRDGVLYPQGQYTGYDALAYEKWRWWMQEAARKAKAKGDYAAHDAIVRVSLPQLEAGRSLRVAA